MSCKVGDVLSKYDIEHYDDRLIDQWTAPKPERKGYRQLARWLNTNLLRREMDRAGLSTLAGEVESKYERLKDDSATADELQAYLRREGLPVDNLMSDFVSYGVVRTHLQECLGVEREAEASDWEAETIRIARDHAKGKIAEAARSLHNKGEIGAGEEMTIHLTAEIECESCHTSVPVERAMRRGYVCTCTD